MYYIYNDELYHHGIKGQKWGIRRYQNEDGSYTEEGKKRYGINSSGNLTTKGQAKKYRDIKKTAKMEGYKGQNLDKRIKEIYKDNDEYQRGKKYYKESQTVNRNRAILAAGGAAAIGGWILIGKKYTNETMKHDIALKHDTKLYEYQNAINLTNEALSNMEKEYGKYVNDKEKAEDFLRKSEESSGYAKTMYKTAYEGAKKDAELHRGQAIVNGKSAMQYKEKADAINNERETLYDQFEYLKKHPFSDKAIGGWKPV